MLFFLVTPSLVVAFSLAWGESQFKKKKALQQFSGLHTLIKKRFQHGCFPVTFRKVLGTAFFIEQFRWLFFNYVLVSERIFKNES